MVHLNKNQLRKQQLDNLFIQLDKTIGKLSVKETGAVLVELLGREERIMLAKRLAVVILLIEGCTMYKAAKTLKLSPTTVEKIHRGLENGAFKNLIRSLSHNRKEYMDVLEALDSILHLGGLLPSYNGLSRYKLLK